MKKPRSQTFCEWIWALSFAFFVLALVAHFALDLAEVSSKLAWRKTLMNAIALAFSVMILMAPTYFAALATIWNPRAGASKVQAISSCAGCWVGMVGSAVSIALGCLLWGDYAPVWLQNGVWWLGQILFWGTLALTFLVNAREEWREMAAKRREKKKPRS